MNALAQAMRPTLSIVVPVKDEEEAIGPFVARMTGVLDAVRDTDGSVVSWEIIFIDDGSSDATMAAILLANDGDPRITALSLSRNFGKEAALSAGLDNARGQAVVPIDVDMQDPPEVIGEMVRKWRDGYEVVYGVRRNRMSDSLPKRLTADLYYRAHNWLSSDKIPEHAGDFRLLDRRVVEVIKRMPERNRFMKGLFAWSGFRQTAVEYDRVERADRHHQVQLLEALDAGDRRHHLRLHRAVAGLVLYRRDHRAGRRWSMRCSSRLRTMIYGADVAGYPSLMVAILFMGGVQLLSLGVLGEYVGRILVETKHRPIYIIRQRIGCPDSEDEAA